MRRPLTMRRALSCARRRLMFLLVAPYPTSVPDTAGGRGEIGQVTCSEHCRSAAAAVLAIAADHTLAQYRTRAINSTAHMLICCLSTAAAALPIAATHTLSQYRTSTLSQYRWLGHHVLSQYHTCAISVQNMCCRATDSCQPYPFSYRTYAIAVPHMCRNRTATISVPHIRCQSTAHLPSQYSTYAVSVPTAPTISQYRTHARSASPYAIAVPYMYHR
eukprot:1500301-Rhodomonas_salina.2